MILPDESWQTQGKIQCIVTFFNWI